MSELSTSEVAHRLGVSQARVRQLINAGRLEARRVGGRWVIEASALRSTPRNGRPMSPRIGWGLVLLGDGHRAEWLSPGEVYRLRGKLTRLIAAPAPELLLRSWLAARAERLTLSATNVDAVRADPRIVLAGISDPRSGMSAASEVEGYVREDQVGAVRFDHLLIPVPAARANVILHSSALMPDRPVPGLLVVADLADHDGPRELSQARRLIAALRP